MNSTDDAPKISADAEADKVIVPMEGETLPAVEIPLENISSVNFAAETAGHMTEAVTDVGVSFSNLAGQHISEPSVATVVDEGVGKVDGLHEVATGELKDIFEVPPERVVSGSPVDLDPIPPPLPPALPPTPPVAPAPEQKNPIGAVSEADVEAVEGFGKNGLPPMVGRRREATLNLSEGVEGVENGESVSGRVSPATPPPLPRTPATTPPPPPLPAYPDARPPSPASAPARSFSPMANIFDSLRQNPIYRAREMPILGRFADAIDKADANNSFKNMQALGAREARLNKDDETFHERATSIDDQLRDINAQMSGSSMNDRQRQQLNNVQQRLIAERSVVDTKLQKIAQDKAFVAAESEVYRQRNIAAVGSFKSNAEGKMAAQEERMQQITGEMEGLNDQIEQWKTCIRTQAEEMKRLGIVPDSKAGRYFNKMIADARVKIGKLEDKKGTWAKQLAPMVIKAKGMEIEMNKFSEMVSGSMASRPLDRNITPPPLPERPADTEGGLDHTAPDEDIDVPPAEEAVEYVPIKPATTKKKTPDVYTLDAEKVFAEDDVETAEEGTAPERSDSHAPDIHDGVVGEPTPVTGKSVSESESKAVAVETEKVTLDPKEKVMNMEQDFGTMKFAEKSGILKLTPEKLKSLRIKQGDLELYRSRLEQNSKNSTKDYTESEIKLFYAIGDKIGHAIKRLNRKARMQGKKSSAVENKKAESPKVPDRVVKNEDGLIEQAKGALDAATAKGFDLEKAENERFIVNYRELSAIPPENRTKREKIRLINLSRTLLETLERNKFNSK